MFPTPDMGSREQKMKQIKNWAGSETDKSSADYHPPKKIKFPLGVSLIAACYANDIEEFKRLLSMGIDINTRNPDGMTCVHQCCINGAYEFLEFLIKSGADINVQDNEGWTPIHAAASVGCEEMVKLLLDNGADVSLLSCEMELPVDVSQSDAVTELLNEAMRTQGIDPAVARRTEEQLLLCDVEHMLKTGKYEPIIDPRTGATPLHVAACKDYLTVLKMLLEIPGVDLNSQDNDGWTPLHAAAHWNREASVRLLVEAGASFDLYNYASQSVFDVADRQLVVWLRQLRERQRTKTTAPTSVPSIMEQVPKATEAIKRSQPLDSKSGDDNDELPITANKKPALDSTIGPMSAAAGDHSSNGTTSMIDDLPGLNNDEPSKNLADQDSHVSGQMPSKHSDSDFSEGSEESQESCSDSEDSSTSADTKDISNRAPNASSVATGDHSLNGSSEVKDALALRMNNRSANAVNEPAKVEASSPVTAQSSLFIAKPSAPEAEPSHTESSAIAPSSPTPSYSSQTSSTSVSENSSEFGSTDTESDRISSAADAASNEKAPTSHGEKSAQRPEDTAVIRVSPSPLDIPSKRIPTSSEVKDFKTPVNGIMERKRSPVTTQVTNSTHQDESVQSVQVSNSDRRETHVRLPSPTSRPIPTRSPSPPAVPPRTVQVSEVTKTTSLSSEQSQPKRIARIVTIPKRIPSSNAATSDSNAASSAPVDRAAAPVTPVSAGSLSVNSATPVGRTEIVRSSSPLSGDEGQTNRRVSYVMARTKCGETETQRSVNARRALSHRRSTQGVSAETLEEAKRLQDKNNSAAVLSGASTTTTDSQPGVQKKLGILNEESGEASVRPDRSTLLIIPSTTASHVSTTPSATESNSDVRRYPAEDSSSYNADSASRSHYGYRPPGVEERVISTSGVPSSTNSTYFPHRGVSARIPSTDEDRFSSRNASSVDSQSRGSRDRSKRDYLMEATERLEREQALKKLNQRSDASGKISPSPTSNISANSTGSAVNDTAVKPVVSRPSSHFLHSKDSFVNPPVSSVTGGSATNFSYVTSRSNARTTPTITNVTQSQSGNTDTVTNSRYGTDSRSDYRDRSHHYQENLDYYHLYQQEQESKKQLQLKLEDTKRELSRLRRELASLTQPASNNSTYNNNTAHTTAERSPTMYTHIQLHNRLLDREDKLKEVKRLREENLKIKEENGALIRVISKLSKPS